MGRSKTSSLKIVTVLITTLGLGPACDHHRWVPDLALDLDVAAPDVELPDTMVPDTAKADTLATDLPPPTGWIAQAGCKGKTSQYWIQKVVGDGAGNTFLTGWFIRTACIGKAKLVAPGTMIARDSYVARVDASGKFAWVAQIAGYNHDVAWSLAVDQAGNSYVAGQFSAVEGNAGVKFGAITRYCGTDTKPRDYCSFVAKLDAAGKFLWVVSGNTKDGGMWPRDLAVDHTGALLVTGYIKGAVTLGSFTLTAKTPELFLGRLDGSGKWLQAVATGGVSQIKNTTYLALDTAGNRYVTGSYLGQASFGATVLSSTGQEDVFVTKVDPAGKVLWALSAGGPGEDAPRGITLDSAGDALIVGSSWSPITFGSFKLALTGKADGYVVKLTPQGKILWAVASHGSGKEWPHHIATDASGNSYIAGTYSGTARFGSISLTSKEDSQDGFVARLDKNGTFTKAISWGSIDHDRVNGIVLDAASSIYLAGVFKEKTTFGSYTLTNNSFWDLFIWKIPAL